jgi:cell division protein FtsW
MTTVKQALVPAGLVAILVIGLVLAGRDLGTVTVMIILVAAAFWTAGLPLRFFVTGTTLAVGGVILMVWNIKVLHGRIDAWLSPTCDAAGACMQSTHGMWALASGGVWGLGPGLSREKWLLLPKPHNDFIYAILGEEFGLIGTVFVLIALAMIVIAVNRLVRRHRDPFIQITSAAIGAWIVGQAMLNIAVVIGLAPVTGVPLPFISSGGSSLVMSLVGMGVLLSFARREPGAQAAFAARGSVVRRSLAVVSRGRSRRG